MPDANDEFETPLQLHDLEAIEFLPDTEAIS